MARFGEVDPMLKDVADRRQRLMETLCKLADAKLSHIRAEHADTFLEELDGYVSAKIRAERTRRFG